MKNRISRLSMILVGLVFLLSASAKAWGGNSFARLIIQYGASWFTAFVPVLIAAETGLAIFLILNIFPKWTTILSACLIVFVTCVYSYGLIFLGITDCGCFGQFEIFNNKPWITFVRNAFILILCVLAFMLCDESASNNSLWKIFLMVVFTAVNIFICGIDMGQSFQLPPVLPSHDDSLKTLDESGLTKYIPMSNDSSYAVYLFSYTCAYCQNSFANVEQYKKIKHIDHVYGLAIDDTFGKNRFYNFYNPSIDIVDISKEEMRNLVSELPVFYLIENGKITHTEVGFVISPGIKVKK